jgi:hypothetical protein
VVKSRGDPDSRALALFYRRHLRAVEEVPKCTANASVVSARELDQGVFPNLGTQRGLLALPEKTQIESGGNHYDQLALVASRESAHVRGVLTAHPQRDIFTPAKQVRVLSPELQHLPG